MIADYLKPPAPLTEEQIKKLSPEQLKKLKEIEIKIIENLRKLQRHKDTHGSEYFKPFWYQQKIIDAMWAGKKTLILQGGNQVGKTLSGSCLIDSFCRGVQAWDGKQSIFGGKPTKGRIICVDWEQHAKEVMVPKLKQIIHAGTYETSKNNMGVEAYWQFKNGSRFNILTHSQDTMSHESDTLDWVWFDEPPQKDKYTANIRGLVKTHGICLITMTAMTEAWILDDIILSTDPQVIKDTFCVTNIDIRENKSLTEEAIRRFESSCDKDERQARIHGGWLALTGLILKKFNKELHIKEPFTVPVDWPVTAMIDPHINNPQAVGFYAVTPYGRKYAIDEIWANMSPEELADEIVRRKKQNTWRLERAYIDPFAKGDDRENRRDIEDTFTIMKKRLNPYGILLSCAERSERAKENGIRNIEQWLMEANKEPSVFFFNTCKRHIHEIQRWKYDDSGKPSKEGDDHFMENLYRYTLTAPRYTEPTVSTKKRKRLECGVI